MALIACPECGGKVSSFAEICPHCGYPIHKYVDELAKANQSHQLKVGDTFVFGKYVQGLISTVETDIRWIVLDIVDEYSLLISECCLDFKPYCKVGSSYSWKKSDIRNWLNEEFFNSAFKDEEKVLIPSISQIKEITDYYSANDTIQGEDKVFLLSISEAKSAEHLIVNAKDTEYVERARFKFRNYDIKNFVNLEEKKPVNDRIKYDVEVSLCEKGCWWLRSTFSPCFISGCYERRLGAKSGFPCGIRPVIWVKTQNYK